MSTVLVNSYAFRCEECGLLDDVMIAGNLGAWAAAQEIIDIHARLKPNCKGGRDTIRITQQPPVSR